MKLPLLATASLTLALLGGASAFAADTGSGGATATGSIAVSATVSVTCTVSGGPLAFGTYASGAATSGTSTITVDCDGDPSVTPSIAVDAGLNTDTGTSAASVRRMVNGTNYLNYTLASTSGGTDLASGGTVSATQESGSQTLTLYGTIPSAQEVEAGSYTDTVGLTLTY